MSPQPESAPTPAAQAPRPIIVIKRKVAGHGGHHGGAWKVAYADFVTAMMALFIVLWLMNADEKVKEEISAFFNNPTGNGTQTGTAAAGAGHSIQLAKEDMAQLKQKMEEALKTMPNFRDMKENVEMTITVDGLRIELLETQEGMFFESGRPLPTPTGAELLSRLAKELGALPNKLLIEGHTDAQPFAATEGNPYSNWELSADRANAARRLMESHGVRPEQVAQVRGFGARQLRYPQDPDNASNRRVSVIVQYVGAPSESQGAPKVAEGNAKPGEGKREEGNASGNSREAVKGEPAGAGRPAEASKSPPPHEAAQASAHK